MNWFAWVLIAFGAIFCYCVGYSCGYYANKKEIDELIDAALNLHKQAEDLYNKSEANLSNAKRHYMEARRLLDEMKGGKDA